MENKDKENVSLETILIKYLRHWKLFLIVFALSFIPAILYLKIFPRTYKFEASILLQDEKESSISGIGMGEAASLMKSFGMGVGDGSLNLDDEMEILASKRIFRAMIHDLGINISYSEPFSLYKMYQEAPLRLTTDSATMANLQDEFRFTVSVSQNLIKVNVKSWLDKVSENFTFTSLPATIKIDRNTFTLDFDHDGAQKKDFKLKITVFPPGWMAEKLIKQVEIEDISKSSNVIYLACSDHSRQRGIDMLNTLIRVYNEDSEIYKHGEADKVMDYVDGRIAGVMTELDKVESNLQDFKKKNDMTLLEADVSLYGELFKDIKLALTEAEMQAYSIDLLDEYVKNPENHNKAIPSVFSVDEGEKGVITLYNKAVVSSEKLLLSSNERNDLYLQSRREADVLRESVHTMIGNARMSITKQLNELKSQEKQLMDKFKTIPDNEREYLGFIRDQEIFNGIYLLMLQKREETIFSLGRKLDRARVIEPPYILKKPLGPRKLFAGIGIIVFTLVIPIGFLFAKDLFISLKKEYRRNEN